MMRVVSLALTLQLASALPRQLQTEGGKNCFDGKDNDGDGVFDCQDPDCYNGQYAQYCVPGGKYCQPHCHTSPVGSIGLGHHGSGKEGGKACFDGIDNDGDGLKDCDDPDCINGKYGKYCTKGKNGKSKVGYGACRSETDHGGRCCFDGKDNDGDGQSDCEDPDCIKDARIGQKCKFMNRKGGSKGKGRESGKACFDGIDNDGDGQKDCADPDCQRDPKMGRYCRQKAGNQPASMPANCQRFYDGCNTCNRRNGQITCTKRMCFRKGKARCRQWVAGSGH